MAGPEDTASDQSQSAESGAEQSATTGASPGSELTAILWLFCWPLLALLAIVAAFTVALMKLPDPPEAGTVAIAQPMTEDHGTGSWTSSDASEAERELALAAITSYVKKHPNEPFDFQKLMNVLGPFVDKGLIAKDIGKEVVGQVLGKDGWLEQVAKFGGDLLKDYLHEKWKKELGGDGKPGPANPLSVHAPVFLTCSPVINPAPPQIRYVTRTVRGSGGKSSSSSPSSGTCSPNSAANQPRLCPPAIPGPDASGRLTGPTSP